MIHSRALGSSQIIQTSPTLLQNLRLYHQFLELPSDLEHIRGEIIVMARLGDLAIDDDFEMFYTAGIGMRLDAETPELLYTGTGKLVERDGETSFHGLARIDEAALNCQKSFVGRFSVRSYECIGNVVVVRVFS